MVCMQQQCQHISEDSVEGVGKYMSTQLVTSPVDVHVADDPVGTKSNELLSSRQDDSFVTVCNISV